mgnify:CR=1 FL=1
MMQRHLSMHNRSGTCRLVTVLRHADHLLDLDLAVLLVLLTALKIHTIQDSSEYTHRHSINSTHSSEMPHLGVVEGLLGAVGAGAVVRLLVAVERGMSVVARQRHDGLVLAVLEALAEANDGVVAGRVRFLGSVLAAGVATLEAAHNIRSSSEKQLTICSAQVTRDTAATFSTLTSRCAAPPRH